MDKAGPDGLASAALESLDRTRKRTQRHLSGTQAQSAGAGAGGAPGTEPRLDAAAKESAPPVAPAGRPLRSRAGSPQPGSPRSPSSDAATGDSRGAGDLAKAEAKAEGAGSSQRSRARKIPRKGGAREVTRALVRQATALVRKLRARALTEEEVMDFDELMGTKNRAVLEAMRDGLRAQLDFLDQETEAEEAQKKQDGARAHEPKEGAQDEGDSAFVEESPAVINNPEPALGASGIPNENGVA
mmetsp:Transcript_11127/g.26124  ORF Transcript_11127/g.26124 Transcript_11127/m.26124 type:complete len:243 (-) Transcript_11127:139-867(-)